MLCIRRLLAAGVRLVLPIAALLAAVAFFVGCGTPTKTTTLWQAPIGAARPVKKIVIFGARLGPTSRRTVEDGFASAFAARGVVATPSYVLFPGDLPDPLLAREEVQKAGFDGILATTFRAVQERDRVVSSSAPPPVGEVAPNGGGFWGNYYGAGGVGGAAYVVTDEMVNFETTLWDSRGDGKMLWSASTLTTNPSSGKDFVKSLTGKVLPELEKSGFLPATAR